MYLTLPQRLLLGILAFVTSFAAGYATHWSSVRHATAIVEAKQEVITQTITAAVDTTDKTAITRLQSSLLAAKNRAANLELLIKDQSNAMPPAVVCALPVGLRDQINTDLAATTR